MGAGSKELKGYIKTETVMLIVLIALALGFVSGVTFSAYRSSAQMTSQSTSQPAAPPLSIQQREQLADLIEQTKVNPNDVAAWTQLGHLYFDTGQHAQAIDAYQRSLQLNDKRPDIWTDLGVMHRRNNDPQKAIQAFDRALAINQRHEIALFNKGVVLMHDLKDPKAALAAWEELIEINPQAKTPGGQTVREFVEQLKQ